MSATAKKSGQELTPLPFPVTLEEQRRRAVYRWVAQVVSGKSVLDVSFGIGDGARILAAAGASAVLGANAEPKLTQALRAELPAQVEIAEAELAALTKEGRRFDFILVSRVESATIEEAQKELTLLSGLLGEGGVLIAAAADESSLSESLITDTGGFQSVRSVFQYSLGGVLIAGNRLHAETPLVGPLLAETSIGATHDPVPEQVIFLASDGELPAELSESFSLSIADDLREWSTRFTALTEQIEAQEVKLAELEDVAKARKRLRKSIAEVSAENAELRAINQRQADDLIEAAELFNSWFPNGLDAFHKQLETKEHELQEARANLDRSQRALSDIKRSPSWRLTAPLRQLKSRLGR